MADVLKTSGPITVERNTTITDVKGQKHTGLKQKTVVDANQKSLVSFSVGSTTKLQVAQAADGKTYVSFDASLFTTRDGKIPPAFKIGNTCMLEVTKTGTNSPVSIDFSKDETRMTIKSSDGQEYTLFVHAGGAKLEMGEGDSRQVFTYNSVDEKGEVIPLDASVSTECIERLCDQNDQLLSMPDPAKNTDIEKTRAQLPPYYIALAYCKAKGINHDPAKAMTTLIEDPNPNNKGVSYFVYTPPTAENKQNAVNPLILAKTPDNGICFYSDGKWFAVDQYFFQTIGKNGELNLYFNATTNRQNSYEYALNTGGDLSDFAESKGEDDVAKKNALNELVNFIQSGKKQTEKEYGQPITCRNDTSTPGYKLAEGLTVHPTPKDKRNTLYINLKQRLNNLAATQEETGGIEPPPPPPRPFEKTPLKKVTEQKKYGPMPGHIVTVLAIALMMCSVLLGPIAGAVIASIGAVAFLGGQGYIMALDYLNDPLHSIKTKYIDPLTEQEREYENQQEAFWENDKALDQNLEQAQFLVAGFEREMSEDPFVKSMQDFFANADLVNDSTREDFLLGSNWAEFLSENNANARNDMLVAFSKIETPLSNTDVYNFINQHIYKGSDTNVLKAIHAIFVSDGNTKLLNTDQILKFSKFSTEQKEITEQRHKTENRQHNILVYGDKRIFNATILNPNLTPEQRVKLVERYADDIMERFVCESDMDSFDFQKFISSFPEQERGYISQVLLTAQGKLESTISLEHKKYSQLSKGMKTYTAIVQLAEQLVGLSDSQLANQIGNSNLNDVDFATYRKNTKLLGLITSRAQLLEEQNKNQEKIQTILNSLDVSSFLTSSVTKKLSKEAQDTIKDFIANLYTPNQEDAQNIQPVFDEREELVRQTSFDSDLEKSRELIKLTESGASEYHIIPSYLFDKKTLNLSRESQIDHYVRGKFAQYFAKQGILSQEKCMKLSQKDFEKKLQEHADNLPDDLKSIKSLYEKNQEAQKAMRDTSSKRIEQASQEPTNADVKTKATNFINTYAKKLSKSKTIRSKKCKEVIEQITPAVYQLLNYYSERGYDEKALSDLLATNSNFEQQISIIQKLHQKGKVNLSNATISLLFKQQISSECNEQNIRNIDQQIQEEAADILNTDGTINEDKLKEKGETLQNQNDKYENNLRIKKELSTLVIETIGKHKELAPYAEALKKQIESKKHIDSFDDVIDVMLDYMVDKEIQIEDEKGKVVSVKVIDQFLNTLGKNKDGLVDSSKKSTALANLHKNHKMTRKDKKHKKNLQSYQKAFSDQLKESEATKAFNNLIENLPESTDLQIKALQEWYSKNAEFIKGTAIGDIFEKYVLSDEKSLEKLLGECKEKSEKKLKKLGKTVKKKLKKARKNRKIKKKKKQRKIDKQKAKTAKETLNNEISNAEARESAAAAAERERHAAAEREAGSGHASESSEEMAS